MNNTPLTIVVVGGVAGGASAATRARRCNESARIVLFEKDQHASFANCGLPYHIGGEIADREKLIVAKPALFRDRFNIELHTRHEVTAIDRTRKVVTVRNRDTDATFEQPYDKLILAPGAAPLVPPIAGVDAANVFTLRNLEDTDRIQAALASGGYKRITVVGAGFIGLEMVEQLHRRGYEIDLVEMLPQVLPPLDPEMAHIVQEALTAKGIAVHLGNGLQGLEGDGAIQRVVLSDGAAIVTDAVILGMGVRPSIQLAQDAGLDLGKMGGIVVNGFLQTSDPDIYAAGDAVEYPDTFLGQPLRIPLAGPANRAGRIAGQHAATGNAHPMPPVQATAILRVFDKAAGATGLNQKLAAKLGIPTRTVTIAANHHAGYYPGAQQMILKLVYAPDTGNILGAQAVGGDGVDKRIDIIATAMHFGGTVYDLAGVDLSYAPPFGSAKDPVHMAAFAACNDLDGLSPAVPSDVSLDGLQQLDVRNPGEVTAMRLPGAIHIPLDELRTRLGELDPSKPTLVYCHSGLRAHVAARILLQHGFNNVQNMTGGMLLRQHATPNQIQRG